MRTLLPIIALGALVYGIIEGPSHGWASQASLVTFAVSPASVGAQDVRRGLVRDGDMIEIDCEKRTMDVVGVTDAEMEKRKKEFKPLPLKATSGTLYKYIKNVASASKGCLTDL